MIQCWRLDDATQTLVVASQQQRLAEIIYWGAALPQGENLESLFDAQRLDSTGGMLDQNPELSICPAAARSFPGQPGLILSDLEGNDLLPEFKLIDALATTDDQLKLHYADQLEAVHYHASFKIYPDTNVLQASATLDSTRALRVRWLAAPVFPAPQNADQLLDFSGRWCGELQMQSSAWTPGMRQRENRTGRTGHEHFPGLILPCRGAQNTCGEAYAFHYGWSGGHRMIAEELADGRRQIQFGHATATAVDPCHQFATAPLYCTYSNAGINGCAIAFQRHLRNHIVKLPNPAQPRPVHYNCWEAIYFEQNDTELKEIASLAAKLGAERFVLDDGWFGQRDDDRRSLADWIVDPRKFPQGLEPLINHVKQLGMSFGLWFEPEMISPDSDVYRRNPDWAFGPAEQILGRHQKAINMALPEVQEFLFTTLSAILTQHDIDYIKWDHNRVLPNPDASQTRGTYDLIDRLRSRFPTLEIESCASGGGRIDFGILSRTHRVWLSDSNDALERLKIQHNAALFLPALVTGSHVGPRSCATSGRVLDISFRAWVAAQRHLGFEMDPRELTDVESEVLIGVTAWWKANRHWMMAADILRLDSPDSSILGELQRAEDGSRFVAFIGRLEASPQILPRPIALTGLEAAASYQLELVNRQQAVSLSRGKLALKEGHITLSGAYLMSQGLNLPWSFPQTIWVVQGVRL